MFSTEYLKIGLHLHYTICTRVVFDYHSLSITTWKIFYRSLLVFEVLQKHIFALNLRYQIFNHWFSSENSIKY